MTVSNWEKTMKEWDDSIPDGIKYLSAEKRVLTRKVRELESENANLAARIAELEEAQRWIPVSERLPENENDQVLIRRGNVVALGWIYFDELMGDWDYRCYDEDWDGNPTHWMPLPTPPEVQE